VQKTDGPRYDDDASNDDTTLLEARMSEQTIGSMNSDTTDGEFKIADRERAIDLCSERRFEIIMSDSDFVYDVARYGHPGYETASDLELLTELDLFNLLDIAIEEGAVVRET
jgi:hypothetical protein